MCIICVSPQGAPQPSLAQIEAMFAHNPHGAGYMVARNGKVEIHKGFMSLEDFTRQLHVEAFTPDDSVVYHFRISTQAGITPAMTHPFPLTTRLKTCTQLDLTCPCGVAHNGIIQLTSNPREKTYSDTVRFITRYLTRLIRSSDDLHDQPILDMIYLLTNSKFAIMDTTGYVATVGDFIHAGGLLFSNSTFIESPISYTANRKYSSKGKVAFQL